MQIHALRHQYFNCFCVKRYIQVFAIKENSLFCKLKFNMPIVTDGQHYSVIVYIIVCVLILNNDLFSAIYILLILQVRLMVSQGGHLPPSVDYLNLSLSLSLTLHTARGIL